MATIPFVGCHPRNFLQGRRGFRPEAIVMHVMAGSMAGTEAWFRNPDSGVSAHYGVGRDGEVVQYVKEVDSAFHAGKLVRATWAGLARRPGVNPNYYTIGIEHEGKANDRSWPDQQLAASRRLVQDIARRWAIPIDAAHLPLHREIRADKTCPGSGFDRARFLAEIGANPVQSPPLPSQVASITTVNVRAAPTTASMVRGRSPAGTTFAVKAVETGEAVRGNSLWYKVDGDLFLWAGGTTRPNG